MQIEFTSAGEKNPIIVLLVFPSSCVLKITIKNLFVLLSLLLFSFFSIDSLNNFPPPPLNKSINQIELIKTWSIRITKFKTKKKNVLIFFLKIEYQSNLMDDFENPFFICLVCLFEVKRLTKGIKNPSKDLKFETKFPPFFCFAPKLIISKTKRKKNWLPLCDEIERKKMKNSYLILSVLSHFNYSFFGFLFCCHFITIGNKEKIIIAFYLLHPNPNL